MTTGYNESLLSPDAAKSRYAGVGGDGGSESGWGTSLTGHDTSPEAHLTKPKWVSRDIADPFYYNGPATNPWDMHSAEAQRRQATMETWQQPARRAVLDRFGSLLQQYGHTNTPGTLWAIAQSGLSTDTDALQSVLATDAKNRQSAYAASMPAQASSPNSDGGLLDNLWPDNIWEYPQDITRNAFAALSMPLEALQGSWRGIGGALTDESQPWLNRIGEAGLQAASLLPPVAAIVDGSIVQDNQFQNPWEQTQFGQTLLYGANNDWTDAFTKAQADLDTDKALELINTDPRYASERAAIMQDPGKQESIAQGVAKKEGLYGNPGWFIGETSQVGEAQRQSTYLSWAIPGPQGSMTAWTLGRGIAGATMGPDWAGYGFTSGLIDAVASVFGDPTIIGGKFGVVGKSLRGIGMLAEKAAPEALKGAELALTVGKEAEKVRQGIGVTNRNSRILVDEYNRLTTVKGVPIHEAAPLAPEEFAKMDVAAQATIVRTMKEAQAAENAIKAAQPSTSVIHQTARSIRRSLARADRGNAHLADAPEDGAWFAKAVDLWKQYDSAVKVGDAPVPSGTGPRVWQSHGTIEEARGLPPAAPAGPAVPAELKWRKRGDSFTSDNWKISVGPDGRATLNDLTGVSEARVFINADKAKEAAAKAAGSVAAPEIASGVRTYGDHLLYKKGDKWFVEAPDGTDMAYKTKKAAEQAATDGQKALDEAGAQRAAVYDMSLYEPWYQTLAPEDQAIWNKSVEYMDQLVADGKVKLTAEGGAREEELVKKGLAHFRGKARSKKLGRPASKYAKQVDADAAVLVLSEQSQRAFEKLKGIDTAGVTFESAPVPGVAQRTVHDGVDAVTYWATDRPPVLAEAGENLTDEQAASLGEFLTEIMKRPGMTLTKAPVPKGEIKDLPGQIADTIKGIEDPMPFIKGVLDNPEARSFGRLLNLMAEHGLDGYYDDWLRTQTNAAGEALDGINGVNRISRDGVWMGDHPLLESYIWPKEAVNNASLLGGSLDTLDPELLKSIPQVAERFGLRSLTATEAEGWVGDSQKALAKAMAQRKKQIAAALTVARSSQARMEQDIAAVGARFADPETTLRTVLQHEAGLATSAGRGASVSPEALRMFLFGNGPLAAYRARTLKVLGDVMDEKDIAKFKGLKEGTPEYKAVWDEVAPRYLGLLNQLTKNRWDAETYKAVLKNSINRGGEDGLVATLAPRLGIDVEKGSIATMKASGKDGARTIESFRTSNGVVKRTVRRAMEQRPGQREVQLDRSQDVIDSIIKYGMYARMPIEDIQRYVGEVLNADGTFGAVATNVDVLKRQFNDIGKILVKNVETSGVFGQGEKAQARLKELQDAITESTRLFLGGQVEKPDVAARVGHNMDIDWFVDANGNRVGLPRVLLDSELINGYLSLPSVDEWQAGMGRIGAAIHRFPKVESVYDLSRSVYDNFFRTSLLVFRAAYILRNSAEMQIRMFLNGHHSVFSDPTSLVGMTLSSGLGGKRAKVLGDMYSPYQHTVLDTAFEVGADEQAAFTNHVQDYFAITRQSNSLTDPRVYKSTVYRGWQRVDVDKPQFALGWANELIMLNRSPLARAVLGNIPGDFAASRSGLTHPERVVEWLMSESPSARKVKQQLVAADSKYAQIFESPSMTMDYLFENVNSVAARVKHFTMDDQVLTDFIKTGVWKGDGKDLALSRMPRLEQRMNSLRGALRDRYWKNPENNRAMTEHMRNSAVTVPWIDSKKLRDGGRFIDGFFRVANTIERLSSVGPEFRMAYWDRVAELLPGLRASDVERATKAAQTTLSPLRKMTDGKVVEIGSTHPAWDALKKAKAENSDGLMTLDQIHAIASDHAAEHVKGLFYDAAQRNNFWSATRLLFPFGQAWGNTLKEWGQLGAKRPVQVYKALKPLYGATESGSKAIYELGEGWAYSDYQDGMAPWDQDPNGGFFYSDQYGDTSFTLPFVGRAAGVGMNTLSAMNGFNPGLNVDMQSNTQSMNLALGADSIAPGTSFLVQTALQMMPDSEIVDNIMNVTSPYGQRDIYESSMPVWLTTTLGGLSAVPGVGGALSGLLSPLSASVKNQNARDAVAILSASGNYDLTDPMSKQRLEQDAANLASSMLLITGIFKNWMPVSPSVKAGVTTTADGFPAEQDSPGVIALGTFSRLYDSYLAENGDDSTAAKEQMLRDFGPAAIFALTGSKAGLESVPSSDAMKWARSSAQNMETARAYPELFSLFFPKGDPTDVIAKAWIEEITSKTPSNLSVQEIMDRDINYMMILQRKRIDFFEANGIVDSDQATQMRADVKEAYAETTAGQQFNTQTQADRIGQVQAMFEKTPGLQNTAVGQAWSQMYSLRDQALGEIRRRAGSDTATFQTSAQPGEANYYKKEIAAAYLADLDQILAATPDAKLLYNMLAEETK